MTLSRHEAQGDIPGLVLLKKAHANLSSSRLLDETKKLFRYWRSIKAAYHVKPFKNNANA